MQHVHVTAPQGYCSRTACAGTFASIQPDCGKAEQAQLSSQDDANGRAALNLTKTLARASSASYHCRLSLARIWATV
eukprot:5134335-Amphidinium_carterae.1